ncbi:MAG: hypothetical protein HYV54_02145 [Parcubacteria group bacterium]|nr:hypothetical protein [Parcubacteria group bacterium]
MKIHLKENPNLAQRINITVPPRTLELLDKVAPKGNRSRIIDEAIRFYFKENNRSKLKKLIRAGASRRSQPNLKLAQEWFLLEEEIWLKNK